MTQSLPAGPAARAALPDLDPVVHSQPRLRIMVVLGALGDGDRITFPRLQELTGITPGNLSTHLRKLEEAGYVSVAKAHHRRVPVTYLCLTRTGRRALEDYTAALQVLLTVPAVHQAEDPAARREARPPGGHRDPEEEA